MVRAPDSHSPLELQNGKQHPPRGLPARPLEAFMESRRARGLSPATIEFYSERLTPAFRCFHPYTATREDIIAYLNSIPPNARGYSTRHAAHRSLKVFYHWLNEEYDFPYPMANLKAPKLGRQILPTLRWPQIQLLLNEQERTEQPVRNRALIMTACATGLRLSELANLKVEDIDWPGDKIRTTGKGNKEAYAPLSFARPYLKAWLEESGRKAGSLFGLNQRGLQIFFKRLGDKHGLKTNPHVFRRSFAVILREMGLDSLTIKDLGRWESLEMVQRYTRDFNFEDANRLLQQKLMSKDNPFNASFGAV